MTDMKDGLKCQTETLIIEGTIIQSIAVEQWLPRYQFPCYTDNSDCSYHVQDVSGIKIIMGRVEKVIFTPYFLLSDYECKTATKTGMFSTVNTARLRNSRDTSLIQMNAAPNQSMVYKITVNCQRSYFFLKIYYLVNANL